MMDAQHLKHLKPELVGNNHKPRTESASDYIGG